MDHRLGSLTPNSVIKNHDNSAESLCVTCCVLNRRLPSSHAGKKLFSSCAEVELFNGVIFSFSATADLWWMTIWQADGRITSQLQQKQSFLECKCIQTTVEKQRLRKYKKDICEPPIGGFESIGFRRLLLHASIISNTL
jgi:hypothetical protein